MKNLILGLCLFALPAFADTKLIQISSDRATYAAGDTAILRAMLLTKPDNANFEFEALGKLNGVDLPLERITEFESFSLAQDLEPGVYTWSVEIVIQDGRLARDLKESIAYFTARIAEIDAELATEPPPERVEELLAAKAQVERLAAVTSLELTRIRTKVHGPVTIDFEVW